MIKKKLLTHPRYSNYLKKKKPRQTEFNITFSGKKYVLQNLTTNIMNIERCLFKIIRQQEYQFPPASIQQSASTKYSK